MLSDYQTLATELVRDDAGKIAIAERDRAIAAAVLQYSTDKPYPKVQDVTPDSSQLLPLPAAWEDEFSEIASIEYPIGNVPPTIVNNERYSIYQSPTGKKIQLADGVAVAANNVRVSFTIKRTVDVGTDNIPLQHRAPVACWAAAMLCDELAAFYSSNTDSSVQADSVDSSSRAQEYSARAKGLRKRYFDELGLVEDQGLAPAGVVVNLRQADSQGQERLTHPERFR